jgi:hypothetical protein
LQQGALATAIGAEQGGAAAAGQGARKALEDHFATEVLGSGVKTDLHQQECGNAEINNVLMWK